MILYTHLATNIFLQSGHFLDFGPGVGDTETSVMGNEVLGPLNLSVPIVYYLRRETELYVSYT